MQRIDRSRANPRHLLPFALLVGLTAYGLRLWLPVIRLPAAGEPSPALAHLPSPIRLAAGQAESLALPEEMDGYRLTSVVPAVPGHDMHALYEAEHHLSLFVRPQESEDGRPTSVGRGWRRSDTVAGHAAFHRKDIHGREALAWIARNRRHIVTGDVPLPALRHFAEAYERSQGSR